MELNNATFFADKWTNVASKARWYSNHSAMEPMDPLKSEILVNNVDIALKRLSYQMHQAVLAEVHVMSPSLMEAAEAAQKNLRDVSSQLVWNTLKLQETENENDIMIFVTEKEKEEEICYYYESAEDALEDSRNKHRAEMEAARWKPSRPDEVDVHSAINDNTEIYWRMCCSEYRTSERSSRMNALSPLRLLAMWNIGKASLTRNWRK